MDGFSPIPFQSVHFNKIQAVEGLLAIKLLLHGLDVADWNINFELVKIKVKKYKKTVQLLSYNNHIRFYVHH